MVLGYLLGQKPEVSATRYCRLGTHPLILPFPGICAEMEDSWPKEGKDSSVVLQRISDIAYIISTQIQGPCS